MWGVAFSVEEKEDFHGEEPYNTYSSPLVGDVVGEAKTTQTKDYLNLKDNFYQPGTWP